MYANADASAVLCGAAIPGDGVPAELYTLKAVASDASLVVAINDQIHCLHKPSTIPPIGILCEKPLRFNDQHLIYRWHARSRSSVYCYKLFPQSGPRLCGTRETGRKVPLSGFFTNSVPQSCLSNSRCSLVLPYAALKPQ